MTIIERARMLRPYIEKAAQSLDDQTALQAVELYQAWKTGTEYTAGTRVRYGGKLWRVMQAHTAQEYWTPDVVPSLFEEINETHAGTLTDPIPYSGNMALTAGLHYTQDGVTYLCTRDTGAPVYNALSDLVGIYVEVAE